MTTKEIREQIKAAEKELREEQIKYNSNKLPEDKKQPLKEKAENIRRLKNEINNDILYIKTVYSQLLAIRCEAELLVRENSSSDNVEVLGKVHDAFLLLVEYNKKLECKISRCNVLVAEYQAFVQNNIDKEYQSRHEEALEKIRSNLEKLAQDLHAVTHRDSASSKARDEFINKLLQKEETSSRMEECAPICRCGAKMHLIEANGDVFWSCDKYKFSKTNHPGKKYNGNKDEIRDLFKKQNEAVSLTNATKQALKNTFVDFDEYPNIQFTDYNNYLFQSLSVPKSISSKEHFDELINYSRFRVFTKLPKEFKVKDRVRTVYSLALRLMNRGVAFGVNEKTEAKINSLFKSSNSQSYLSLLKNYVTYKSPHNENYPPRERQFAEYYFRGLFGPSWATNVYSQMPFNLLLPANVNKKFKDERVDFLVCYQDKKVVIEIDGPEHNLPSNQNNDKQRDDALRNNGYIVKRYTNEEVDTKSNKITEDLKKLFAPSPNSTLCNVDAKRLIACKVVHQISTAILKMLEEGHISSNSNLNVKISTDRFFEQEKRLLLLFAIEEVSELVGNFAKLYGATINLNLLDESAEEYWICIGDGDDNRNSIVIRDITLPVNYLCSIHPFALIFPDKSAITENLLEYFLKYVYGYETFKPGQFAAIRRTLRREESIILLPTGSGKSVIYQLSSMLLPGITIVISPLRALIEDQVKNLSDKGVNNVAAIYSSEESKKKDMLQKARAIMNNHSAMMLYIAPERMQIPSFREEVTALLYTNNFVLIAIDEAHCVSEWGHEFRAAYLQIGRSCRNVFKKGEFTPPIVALTGTASNNVLNDVKRDLAILSPDAVILPGKFDRPELHYSIYSCRKEDKIDYLVKLLKDEMPKKLRLSYEEFSKLQGKQTASGLIFTPLARKNKSNYSAWSIFLELQKTMTDLKIGTYFTNMPQILEYTDKNGNRAREDWNCIIQRYAHEFKENQLNLLVATKAFGMGIDKPNIRYVIHNGLSSSIEQYYQEVGRAGRDGNHSECVLLFSNNNAQNEKILDPNIEWKDFNNACSKGRDEEKDDASPLTFLHSQNFDGASADTKMLHTILSFIGTNSEGFLEFLEDKSVNMPADEIFKRLHSNAESENGPQAQEKDYNNIAKGTVRLVTLGVIKDYEYDYSKKLYTITLGSINRRSVREKYLAFIDASSRGLSISESIELDKIDETETDYAFTENVSKRYVDFIYKTIEKGRRRALHSMYRLAQEASKKSTPAKQDKYIREEIENYLVKDDTVELVKESRVNSGIFEITHKYPLYPNDVIIDSLEQEQAKKACGYVRRELESNPDHPGLLYLYAITSIKSRNYHNSDVTSELVKAFENSRKYGISDKISLDFFIKTINLAFNSSCELFELIWEKVEKKYAKIIIEATLDMSDDNISQQFKEYLLLHVATRSLRKMIGDK